MRSASYDDYGYYDEWAYEEEALYAVEAGKSAMDVSYDYYYEEPSSSVDLSEINFDDAMIIKTAYLDIVVESTLDAAAELEDVARSYNGYVQSSYTYEDYAGSMAGTVTFRVPVENFDDAMEDVRGMADVISSESTDSEDVTEEYVDLSARLSTYYELEAQYLAVLDSAYTVEEILMVYDYLQTVREEIESLEGRMQYYENQSSYSTITVYLEEEVSVFVEAAKWRPVEVVKEAFQNWIAFLQGIADGIIWLVIYLWILPVLWLIWRFFRRKK